MNFFQNLLFRYFNFSLIHEKISSCNFNQFNNLISPVFFSPSRPEHLLRDLMLVYDVRVLLQVTTTVVVEGVPTGFKIFESGWVYAIYIVALLSFLPLILSPLSELR